MRTSSDPESARFAIRAERLSKRFRLGVAQPSYKTLRDSVMDALKAPARMFRPGRTGKPEIWALRDVSFVVRPGEIVGIIGRNGAGKSTLLKVLARISEPTGGYAEVRGRVGSLLEVGTGFHPELSGRENVLLNGAILGMRRAEILRKFDAIVDFAEVGPFIDTAVKHYSSGMQLRLAFAVAAHLEPEILFMDEVLAVGDAAFQKKCIGKMGAVSHEGRTVIFVSHNMAAIKELCTRVMWIEGGAIQADGDVDDVIEAYLASVATKKFSHFDEEHRFVIEEVAVKGASGAEAVQFAPGDDLIVDITYDAKEPLDGPHFAVLVEGASSRCFAANMLIDGCRPGTLDGRGTLRCRFRNIPLLPQSYRVNLSIRTADGRRHILKGQDVAYFSVSARLESYGFTGRFYTLASRSTPVVVPYEWTLPDGRVQAFELAARPVPGAEGDPAEHMTDAYRCAP
ncbi:MAG TPA: ABC transporter ATP-binding protein [Bryobacteraceae bacterium]|nr:ABC transporter ATP-binding protein [Bryobacteraceae bacterium]